MVYALLFKSVHAPALVCRFSQGTQTGSRIQGSGTGLPQVQAQFAALHQHLPEGADPPPPSAPPPAASQPSQLPDSSKPHAASQTSAHAHSPSQPPAAKRGRSEEKESEPPVPPSETWIGDEEDMDDEEDNEKSQSEIEDFMLQVAEHLNKIQARV